MKISTSTSFVMAATASLALQSSALALPPDSPDVVRSARTATTARLPDRAGAIRPGSRENSPTRRDLTFRDVKSTRARSVNDILHTVSGVVETTDSVVEETLNDFGMKVREAKGADASSADTTAAVLSPRQVPQVAPLDIAGGVVGSVTQASSSVPSLVAGAVAGAPAQGVYDLPGPLPSLPVPVPVPDGSLQPPVAVDAPVPVPVSGTPSGALQNASSIPQSASGVAQGVGSTVVGTIALGVPISESSAEEGAKEGSADGRSGYDSAENTAEDEASYPDFDGDDADGNFVDETGLASPSSTTAVPSSSPSSSPAVASSTDAAVPSSSDAEFDKDAFSINLPEGLPVSLSGLPTSVLPVPVPIPSSLPVNTSSIPDPLQGTPAASLPVNVTGALLSPPGAPLLGDVPVNAPPVIQVKRAETTSGEISETTGGAGASASASPIDPFSTASSASQPASSTSTVAFEPASSSMSSEPSTTTPSRLSRFLFFRFNRKVNA